MNTIPLRQFKQSAPTEHKRFRATPYEFIDPSIIPPRAHLDTSRFLTRGTVSVTVAPGGLGKSSLGIVESLAHVTAKDLLGHIVGNPLRVWIWNLEDDRDELHRRIAAARQHFGLTADDLTDRLFVDTGREQELCIARNDKNGPVLCQPVIDNLVAEMISRQIDVLVVDPFISSHHVNENDNPAIDMVVKAWAKVAHQANAAIHLVHHTRKQSTDTKTNADSARGAKALVDAARNVRCLERMTEDEAVKADVDNHRLYFRSYSDKANLAPPAEASNWYKLESVSLPNGDDVGVVVPWKWPNPFDDLKPDDLRAVQRAVNGKKYRENAQSKDWVGYAIADVLEWNASDDAVKARLKSCIKIWIANKALKIVEIKDEKGKKRPAIEVGEWA